MSEDQRTAQQWIVGVGESDLKTVKSGESVELGRKPLRPLADDGYSRLDIADSNKSMSKRHAVFAVDDNGTATINTEICTELGYDYDTVAKAFEPYCTKINTITTAESFSDVQQ